MELQDPTLLRTQAYVDGEWIDADSGATFDVTDNESVVSVSYTGVLPDLFKEGQATVAKGSLDPSGVFIANEVLAKHDENYMPPEVAKMLKKRPRSVQEGPESQAGATGTGEPRGSFQRPLRRPYGKDVCEQARFCN